jgi:hypothetical protein
VKIKGSETKGITVLTTLGNATTAQAVAYLHSVLSCNIDSYSSWHITDASILEVPSIWDTLQ